MLYVIIIFHINYKKKQNNFLLRHVTEWDRVQNNDVTQCLHTYTGCKLHHLRHQMEQTVGND